jgi:mRNA interferase MazF
VPIISEDVRNRRTDDVVFIPVFPTVRLGPTRVPIQAGVGGILRDSVLFCEEITTLDRDFLTRGPLGPPVPDDLLERVLYAVRRALGDVVPEP